MRIIYLSLAGDYARDILHRLSSNSPGGLLFPKLESLDWRVWSTEISFFPLFLSPYLQRVTLTADLDKAPESLLTPLVQMISLLPTSLEYLSVMCGDREGGPLGDALSSFSCRCGSLLRGFETSVPLSEAAINHLMRLPNLSHWAVAQEPPRIVPASIFPFLESVWLYEPEALPWLHLLASRERGALCNGSASATPHSYTRETVKSFECPGTIVDLTFLSSVVKFQNLVILNIHTDCSTTENCMFRLTDNDIEDLAASLPRLEDVRLGGPCQSTSCNATVAALLSMSVRCPDLTVLEIHFNTQTIVSDIQRLVDGGAGRHKAKCKLRKLMVGCLSLGVGGEDIDTVAMGFNVIFPCLANFEPWEGGWSQLRSKLAGLRR